MINNIKKLAAVVALATSFVACSTKLDINVDPNNATLNTATPSLVLPSALMQASNIYNTPVNALSYIPAWLGQAGYSGNFAIPQNTNDYTLTTSFGAGSWTTLYDNNADFQLIEDLGRKQGSTFFQGVGKIMKSMNYITLVDLYGNVPYSEAQQGAVNPTPKYDNAIEVYEKCYDDIKAGAALVAAATTTATNTQDIMFAGNKNNWVALANTLRLRILMRQSAKADRAAYITAKMAEIAAGPFLTANAVINPGFLNSDGKQNPFWRSCHTPTGTYTQDFLRPGKYILDNMTANSDPRISRYAKPNGGGGYVGTQIGAINPPNGGNSGSSEFGTGLLQGPLQSAVYFTAAESFFLQAEAIVRGYLSGDAKAMYTAGVNASFSYLGAGSAAAYLSQATNRQTNFDLATANTDKIAVIIRQKFIALAMINVIETYNDYRRLGLPADVVISPVAGANKIPLRLMYPQREFETNPGRQTVINPQVDKIWWMP
jgi:hypothetical protein